MPVVLAQFEHLPGLTYFDELAASESGMSIFSDSATASESASGKYPSIDLEVTESLNSAFLRKRLTALQLEKKMYGLHEKIVVRLRNIDGNTYNLRLLNSEEKETEVLVQETSEQSGMTISVIPTQEITPGKYTLVVEDTDGEVNRQEFLWGVLAFNTDRDQYLSGEEAAIAIAVLDETGGMVCDATVELTIKNGSTQPVLLSTENGKIRVNKACLTKDFTLEPDYEAYFTFPEIGSYDFSLKAKTKNGEYTISETIHILAALDVRMQRTTATRLFPVHIYPVTMSITAEKDMKGTITEVVPSSFEIYPSDDADTISYSRTETVATTSFHEDSHVLGAATNISLPYVSTAGVTHPVTLPFGEGVTDPLLKKKYQEFGLSGHDGIDFDMPSGTPIVPVDDGVVVLAEEEGDYGVTVVVEHEWGKSYYGHLSKIIVNTGEQVVRGKSELGLSGSTGLSTGPHLHLGIKLHEHDPNNGYFGKIDPAGMLGLTSEATVLSAKTQETTPSNVTILSWEVDLKKGEEIRLGYQFKAPEESPKFYTLGPAVLRTESGEEIFKEQRTWQLAIDPVTIDATVSTAPTEHSGSSPTLVFTTDQIGYAFYVNSNGTAQYSKTTNGGTSWGTPVTVDSQTDVAGIAVWYDQWTPGDTTGTRIHIATWDSGSDDIWYRALDTATDTFDAAVVNATGANQGGAVAAGGNVNSITRATNGIVYMGIVDATDSYVIRCSTTCGTATNWTEAGSNPFTNGDNDALILMPIASGDILALWWDDNTDDILSREYEDGANAWQGSWATVDNAADNNTTYDAAFGATLDKTTNDIYLAYADDAATLGAGNDDIKTATYDGASWTAGGDVFTDDPYRGVTNVSISYNMDSGSIFVGYSVQETTNYNSSANVYYRRSTDGMNTWSSEYGQLNGASDNIYGFRMNLMNDERLYATWYRVTSDDLYGTTLNDIVPGEDRVSVGRDGAQVDFLTSDSTNNYIGGAFTFVRNAGSTSITSIEITETGTVDATSALANLDIYYETADTCTYDGTETLFGSASTFDTADTATITGTMSIGTSQVCAYLVVDIAAETLGTIEFEIENPNTDVLVSSGNVPIAERVRLKEPTNISQDEFGTSQTIDSAVQTTVTRHNGSSPTVVFTTDQTGYVFYNDSDGRCKYSKTTDGGESWSGGINMDSQTDCIGVAVWYDQWTPGDSTGTVIHVVTWDTNTDDTWYSQLDTASDTVTLATTASGAGQGGALTAGTSAASITKATDGTLYIGIVDATDSYVIRCSGSCSVTTNWTEAGTNPFTSADNDYTILMPLADGDILSIWWDASADDLLSQEYEDGTDAWQGSWTTIDGNADENVNYDSGFAATLDPDSNTIYLGYIDDASTIAGANDDIKTWSYDGSTWSAGANVTTNDSRGLTQLALSYDVRYDKVFVIYSAITDPLDFQTATVYLNSSSDGMNSWDSEQGTLTQVAEREIYGLRSNLVNAERIYVTWDEAISDDLRGATIEDIVEIPTNDKLMRHGKWFSSSSVMQPFAF